MRKLTKITVNIKFKWLCWTVTLLYTVGLEWVTAKYIHFNVRMQERTDAVTNEVLQGVWKVAVQL
jgi:hypothetical protein